MTALKMGGFKIVRVLLLAALLTDYSIAQTAALINGNKARRMLQSEAEKFDGGGEGTSPISSDDTGGKDNSGESDSTSLLDREIMSIATGDDPGDGNGVSTSDGDEGGGNNDTSSGDSSDTEGAEEAGGGGPSAPKSTLALTPEITPAPTPQPRAGSDDDSGTGGDGGSSLDGGNASNGGGSGNGSTGGNSNGNGDCGGDGGNIGICLSSGNAGSGGGDIIGDGNAGDGESGGTGGYGGNNFGRNCKSGEYIRNKQCTKCVSNKSMASISSQGGFKCLNPSANNSPRQCGPGTLSGVLIEDGLRDNPSVVNCVPAVPPEESVVFLLPREKTFNFYGLTTTEYIENSLSVSGRPFRGTNFMRTPVKYKGRLYSRYIFSHDEKDYDKDILLKLRGKTALLRGVVTCNGGPGGQTKISLCFQASLQVCN